MNDVVYLVRPVGAFMLIIATGYKTTGIPWILIQCYIIVLINVIFQNIVIEKQEHVFSDLDKNKKYSVQIRAKKIYCANSKNWGEWSQPIIIGKGKQQSSLPILMSFASS